MNAAILFLGSTLVVLVVVQLGVGVYLSILCVAPGSRQQRLSLRLLEKRIEAANDMRAQQIKGAPAWNGYRSFFVDRKGTEANGVCSFYLVPHDHKPLPSFRPGQFLTFRLDIPTKNKPVIRCYSLSDSPHANYYRVTIKRVGSPPGDDAAPPGLVSNYFHDEIHEGDFLDVRAPAGQFTLDPNDPRPAVLIGGGIGITPLLSMLNTMIGLKSDREMWLFYGVRNGVEHAWKQHLRDLSQEHPNIHVVVCYSQAGGDDVEGMDYDHQGHIGVELLKKYLGSSNYLFFLCGPPGMMSSLTKQLTDWGVPKANVHSEAFGPASVKAKAAATKKPEPADTEESSITITFAKSQKKCKWMNSVASLLELAEENGAAIDAGCRAGNCGTCEVAVKSGRVGYSQEPEFPDLKEGCCLACIGIPHEDVTLDA